jgi:hypothetical protein
VRLAGWQARVAGELLGRLRDFRLDFEAAGLVLRGRCASYYVKQLAQQWIMDVAGLPIAANRIVVVDISGTDSFDEP